MVNKKLKRRELMSLFAQGGALSLAKSPLALFLSSITPSLLSREVHGATPTNRKWVDFRSDGAPARWVYDLFLNPQNQNNFLKNYQVGTKYIDVNGRYTDLGYATFLHAPSGLHLPWMWQFPLPKPGGGSRPMTDLLTNMLQMRGLNTANSGHGASDLKHFLVPGAHQSVPALAADAGDAPYPAVVSTRFDRRFRSSENQVPAIVTGPNLLESMMKPFLGSASDNSKGLRTSLQEYLNAVSSELSTQAISAHPDFQVTTKALSKVQQIIQISVGDLASKWTALVGKYRDLIRRALVPETPLLGINDRPIGTTATRGIEYREGPLTNSLPDIRAIIDTATTVTDMAEHFALAEYVITNNLADSITLSSPFITNILILPNRRVGHPNDEHLTGRMNSLIINSLYHRSHAACLLELITQFKLKGIFENVVIRNGSEFNRSARDDGSGSDHGFDGASMVFYSGAIQGPHVIGNIRAQGRLPHSGTWGIGAPVASTNSNIDGKHIDFGHALVTIAALLNVPPPLTSRDPLVKMTAQGFVPIIEPGKIIG